MRNDEVAPTHLIEISKRTHVAPLSQVATQYRDQPLFAKRQPTTIYTTIGS